MHIQSFKKRACSLTPLPAVYYANHQVSTSSSTSATRSVESWPTPPAGRSRFSHKTKLIFYHINTNRVIKIFTENKTHLLSHHQQQIKNLGESVSLQTMFWTGVGGWGEGILTKCIIQVTENKTMQRQNTKFPCNNIGSRSWWLWERRGYKYK